MALIKNLIEYLSIGLSVLMLLFITADLLRFYQEKEYALASLPKSFKFFYVQDRTQLLYPLLILAAFLDLWYVQLGYCAYLVMLLAWKWLQRSEPTRMFSPRLKRLLAMIILLETVGATVLHFLVALPQLMSSMVAMMVLTPLWVALSAVMMFPLEMLIAKIKSKNS
ncbi:MAG TPA: hypothetical protein DD618_01490 [Acholeplasmatales bacterium]|nr:hypothetical protein [Acholeplasmatales bacterium]